MPEAAVGGDACVWFWFALDAVAESGVRAPPLLRRRGALPTLGAISSSGACREGHQGDDLDPACFFKRFLIVNLVPLRHICLMWSVQVSTSCCVSSDGSCFSRNWFISFKSSHDGHRVFVAFFGFPSLPVTGSAHDPCPPIGGVDSGSPLFLSQLFRDVSILSTFSKDHLLSVFPAFGFIDFCSVFL